MASILRQIVAGPRLQHPEAGLDLCYVTDRLIATSGPSSNYPQRAYRTPVKDLVNFLDTKHGQDWCIWEFRAEGTGYPDSEVYGRIRHFPFPDHHPPPFALIPQIMASMRNWLYRLEDPVRGGIDADSDAQASSNEKQQQRVAVVHCKAGKGRSGTIACSYLISQEGWSLDDALNRFTERRMRVGFGSGVSIPSQVRWVRYVDRWTNQMGKTYIERPVEILELHVWGLRDGVKVAVEGFVEQGQKIECFHQFRPDERIVMSTDTFERSNINNNDNNNNQSHHHQHHPHGHVDKKENQTTSEINSPLEPLSANSTFSSNAVAPTPTMTSMATTTSSSTSSTKTTNSTSAVLFRPQKPIILPTSDVNIDFERKSKAAYTGLAMVTSIAHIWFNAYFEGGDQFESGVFEVDWEALDGIKGTTRKGFRALDKLKVVWRYPSSIPSAPTPEASISNATPTPIMEPKPGEPIHETQPSDWRLHEELQQPEEGEEELYVDENNNGEENKTGKDNLHENIPPH